MRNALFLLLVLSFVSVAAQKTMKTPKKAIRQLEDFKEFPKFEEDLMIEYKGISDEIYRPELTKLINLAADDFIIVARDEIPTQEKYQEVIKEGLLRFTDIYPNLSQSDILRIVTYYKELMDIVNLNESNSLLSKFQRGIDLD